MNSITVKAPAKVNLFLKVINKRKDGYHNIETLFERISISDRIKISKIPEGIVVSSNKFITADPKDNLVYKAAESIIKFKNLRYGVKISIKKTIPIAAGLGGGSSDAASVIMGMNKLFRLRIGERELMRIAGRLGADCPFFILDTPFAIGRGRGDILRPAAIKASFWHLIVYPGFRVATRAVYEALSRHGLKHLTIPYADVKIISEFTGAADRNRLGSMMSNDLEDVVVSRKKVIGNILKRLAYSSGTRAIVSGSGPSVFCLCPTRKEALETRRKLFKDTPSGERKGWSTFVARTRD